MSDGGNSLDEFLDVNFPRAVRILDFQHAAGHVSSLAKLVRPGAFGERLASNWCHTLKHAGGSRLLKVLEKLDRKTMSAHTFVLLAGNLSLSRVEAFGVPRRSAPAILKGE